MRKLTDQLQGVVDIGIVLMIGICFAGLMVVAYIIWTLVGQLIPPYPNAASNDAGNATNAAWNNTYTNPTASIGNITGGFDSAVSLILVAITVFILAIAISALLMMRGRQQ